MSSFMDTEMAKYLTSMAKNGQFCRRCFDRDEENAKNIPTTTISLDGLIGVGKSTIGRNLSRDFGPTSEGTHAISFTTLPEITNQRLLELFYQNPAKYSFAMQLSMLKSRQFQWALSSNMIGTPHNHSKQHTTVIDRSTLGDYCFALWNHLTGSISIDEMAAYRTDLIANAIPYGTVKEGESYLPSHEGVVAEQSTRFCVTDLSFIARPEHTAVFMSMSPSKCHYLVTKVRGNNAEANIPLSYFEGLEHVHLYMFMHLLSADAPFQANVRIMRPSQYSTPATFLTHYESWKDQSDDKVPRPSIVHHKVDKSSTVIFNAEPNSNRGLVYSQADHYESMVCAISKGDGFEFKQEDSSKPAVIVPKVVFMVDPPTISPTSLGVDIQHMEATCPDIQFYTQNVRTVIIYHLSQGCKINIVHTAQNKV